MITSNDRIMQAMRDRSWCVTVDGKPTYKPTEERAVEFHARLLRVYAREGKSVPVVTITPPVADKVTRS